MRLSAVGFRFLCAVLFVTIAAPGGFASEMCDALNLEDALMERMGKLDEASNAIDAKYQPIFDEKMDQLATVKKWTPEQRTDYALTILLNAQETSADERLAVFNELMQAMQGDLTPERCRDIEVVIEKLEALNAENEKNWQAAIARLDADLAKL